MKIYKISKYISKYIISENMDDELDYSIINPIEQEEDFVSKTLREKNIDRNKLINDYREVGNQQRGQPESIMLKFQKACGDPLIAYLAEHIGDLSHRASECHSDASPMSMNNFVEKVNRTYDILTQNYGFEKESNENLVSNAMYSIIHSNPQLKQKDEELRQQIHEAFDNKNRNLQEKLFKERDNFKNSIKNSQQYKDKIESYNVNGKQIGKEYADAHRNEVHPKSLLQSLGREAAISVGEYNWNKTISILNKIKPLLDKAKNKESIFLLFIEGYK